MLRRAAPYSPTRTQHTPTSHTTIAITTPLPPPPAQQRSVQPDCNSRTYRLPFSKNIMPATLNYFNLPGRAEATRVALALAGIEFEDKHLSFEEFGASSFKHLPVLQMDGVEYTQSTALLRYAGKMGSLSPKDALTALKVDEIVMIAEDCFIHLFSTMSEHNATKKLEKCQALAAGKLKTLLEQLAARLTANKSSPYFVGDSLTIADLQVFAVISTVETGFLEGFPTTMVEDIAPALKELHGVVRQHPKVKAYYATKA